MPTATMTPVDMFNELVAKGYLVPASVEPSASMIPTAYVSVESISTFHAPPYTPPLARTRQEGQISNGPTTER